MIGQTDPEGSKITVKDKDAVKIADIHATVLRALNVDFEKPQKAPFGRSMSLSSGKVMNGLLKG